MGFKHNFIITMILLQAHQLMTLQIRLHIEYPVQTYYIVVFVL